MLPETKARDQESTNHSTRFVELKSRYTTKALPCFTNISNCTHQFFLFLQNKVGKIYL